MQTHHWEYFMSRIKKLTPELLKNLVLKEKKKMIEEGLLGADSNKAKTVDADAYAGTLIHKINHAKALGIKEANLKKRIDKISAVRKALRLAILKEI
jgi:hypothetical protein